ncbi:type II secretion system secretin GspD [Polymorphobacter fuscus]|uniref:Type II secretion system protein GspD n=1 Tax=Sandarakinorhabdus fusca TaxID=1439888 RepID=A0A7C9GP01_9SPHN|nr:type II secretion system secretin GspD [Polymorphobacter fuscus]KAB7649126.1 type II secretion system protein GspD [Polymorphobacter fuscus]MQT16596.1 type II secretion system protein GspD [Polymorphobacter fuscus]
MRPKLWAAVSLLTVMSMAIPAHAQQTINLRDADVRAYIQDVARATGRTFIIDPRVQGKVSVVSERPLGRDAYFELFLSTLRANGLVVIPASGGAFRVQPADGAAAQPGGSGSSRNRFVTQVFRLNSIDAASAAETLRPLISREGQVTSNRSGNAIIVADYADNVARVRSLLGQIDRDRQTTRVVPLKNAGAREIAGALNQLGGSGPGGDPADGGGAARGGVQVVAIDSSNAVALRGDAAAVQKMAETVLDLDRRAAAGADVRVIFLAHADAEKLLPVLQQLVGQAPTTTAPTATTPNTAQQPFGNRQASVSASAPSVSATPIAGATIGRGQAVIARYEGANAIIISAPGDVQRQLGEVIRQLDTRREQVLVEAIIVEISDVVAKKLGVQFLLTGTGGSNIPFSVTNYSNAVPNLLTVAGAVASEKTDPGSTLTQTLRDAAVSTLLSATGGSFGLGGKLGNNAIFGFVINAVKSDTNSNVLSTPSIMTLDNQQAKILVGQEIPISTGESLSSNFDNAFRTIQRQNVGIQLDVKPQINAGGTIKLALRQEVSSIAGPVSSTSSELILNKRELSTTVTVDDGQIIALGGLIDDNERRTIEKVPLLGDIPGLGVLFRSKSRSRTKTNLMVFIRPTIVRSAPDAQRLAAERYNYMRDAELAQNGGNPSETTSLDSMVRDYLHTAPPALPAPTVPR